MAETVDSGEPRRVRWRGAAAAAAVATAALWCFAPALHAYFVLDDFTLLAMARLLHAPWLAFWHDHFPGSLFFRPLGVAVWSAGVALFDNAPRGHYVINALLHLGCVATLYTLLRRLRPDAALNPAWAALFAVHPLAIGTALWLSDRFDLLATAFTLLALNAAAAWTRAPRARSLAAVLGFVLLAFMGKEIAIVGAFACAALLALPNGPEPLPRRERWLAGGAVLALTAAWLGYRHLLLTNPENLLVEPGTVVAVFVKGIGLWLRIAVEYLALDPRVGTATRALLAIGAVLLAAAVVATRRRDGWRPRALGVAAALVVLILLPGPTQAPVVAVSTADLGPATFWFDLIGESRLYHMTLAGLIVALMLATTPAAAPGGARERARVQPLAAAAIAVLLLAAGSASHRIAHDFARRTREQIAPLAAANAAIERLPLPAHGCQVYLLGAASIWGWAGLGDAMIKASSHAPQRLEHCLINTERTPWAHFLRAGSLGPADYAPLQPLRYRGVPIPWLVLDGFETAYLNLESDVDARALTGAFFLEYRNGEFADVTADVLGGARPVHFFNARPTQR